MTDNVKTVVVLGTGPAALPIIRQTMVNHVLKRGDLRMVVVSPSTHFLWPIAMPRAVVPGQLADEKVLIPFEPTFGEFPSDKFEWVQGRAVSLNPSSSIVGVELNDTTSAIREVGYHTLVIATGSRARDDMIWKSLGTAEETKSKLHHIQDQISNAKTIVVAGGGMTGSETAGELGFEYSQHGKKEVIFVYSGNLPLAAPATDQVRKQAQKELEKLKVQLIPDTTVTSATAPTPGSPDMVLELRAADGTTRTITAQAYLPATGIIPNTEFAPRELLDARGYIKQTTRLRAEGHDNIFVVGDAGNLEAPSLMHAEAQSRHMLKALPAYLETGEAPEYAVNKKEMFAVTLGRSRATGQMGTMKLFSFIIWFMKGRYLGTDYAGGWAAGKRTMSVTFEK